MKSISIISGYKCNNNCIFCWNSNKRDDTEPTTKDIKERLVEARKKDSNAVEFLGGEFTIRKDAVELVRFAKEIGFRTISLTTNGRVLSYPEIAKKFVDVGVNSIIYSIHGHTAKLHDYLTRVEGSYEQIVRGIKNTQKLGIPFFASVTISKINYKFIPEIAQFLVDLGCVNAEFVYVNPNGAAYDKFDELVPGVKEVAPYIKEGLDIGIRNNIRDWYVRYYPLCYLEGYERYVSEIKNPFTKVEHSGPEFENLDVEASRRSVAKVKSLSCSDCKYVNSCEGVWRVYAEKKGLSELVPVKDLPEEVKVELTHRCNFDCDFCFNKNYANDKELSLEEVKKIVDNIYDSGFKSVRFTGGEPFLRNDLKEILEYAKSKGLYVILNTNGSLLKEDVLKYVDDILISFHNVKEAKEKEELFKKLRKHKLVLRCCTIATKENISKLEEFYKFMDKQPVDDWFLLRQVPNPENLEPINNDDIEELVGKILSFNKKYKIKTRIANAVPFCSCEPRKIEVTCVGGRNDDGHTRIVVDPEGNIKPSYFSDKIMGNVMKDSLIDCWNSKDMKAIRNLELVPEECKICECVQACKGGLRFAARLVNKKENALDPLAQGLKFVRDFCVLLINPVYHGFYLPIEPLALEYMAAVLEENHYEVKIVDLSVDKVDLKEVIKKFEPDVIGISNMTLQVNEGYRIGNFIKQNFPHVHLVYGGIHQPFVYGGMHSIAFPKEPFEKGSADFVIVHEGDKPLLELVNALEKDKDIEKERIKDLCYKKDEKIVINTEENLFGNLDELPFPARHLVDLKKYKNDIHILPYAKEVAVDVITSRGCPNDCDYCTSPLFYNRRFRVRSAKNVVDEIKDILHKHKIKYIHFYDDIFLLDKKMVKELCEMLIKEKLDIKWNCLASVRSLMRTKELFGLMNKAGCVGVEIGLENADVEVLDKMNKNQKIEEVLMVDKLLKKNNIVPMYLIICFYIGEKINSAKKTRDLLLKISSKDLPIIDYLKSVHLPYSFGQFATPYPATKFYETAKKEGICFMKSWDDYNRQEINFIPYSFLHDVPIKSKDISREEFNKEIDKFKDSINYYLKDPDLIGFSDYNKYIDFLYGIYCKSDGIKNVEKLFPKEDIRFVSLGVKFLSIFDLIKGK